MKSQTQGALLLSLVVAFGAVAGEGQSDPQKTETTKTTVENAVGNEPEKQGDITPEEINQMAKNAAKILAGSSVDLQLEQLNAKAQEEMGDTGKVSNDTSNSIALLSELKERMQAESVADIGSSKVYELTNLELVKFEKQLVDSTIEKCLSNAKYQVVKHDKNYLNSSSDCLIKEFTEIQLGQSK